MGKRAYKRVRMALPVTVSGRDTNGNPFKQTATTVEIGVHGLRLRGVYCLRGRGDTVTVEFKRRQAKYRVAWMNELEGEAGLEGLGDARLLFASTCPMKLMRYPTRRRTPTSFRKNLPPTPSPPLSSSHPRA